MSSIPLCNRWPVRRATAQAGARPSHTALTHCGRNSVACRARSAPEMLSQLNERAPCIDDVRDAGGSSGLARGWW
jgi:hypothetical protein